MRVELLTPEVSTSPGASAELVLDVLNTSDVIDGIAARVVGLDPEWVRCRPAQLALFPDTSDQLAVEISLPPDFPAGRHQLAVEVSSSVDPSDVEYVTVALDVTPNADVALQLEPERASAVRKARYRVTALNAGNTPVALALTAVDADRTLDFRFEPPVVEVAPGQSAAVEVHVRAPRRLFGTPADRPVVVTATGRDLEVSAAATFQHLPLVPRGVLTAGLLASIVAVWAVLFLLVLGQVLDEDPPDKAAPASYFATSPEVLAAAGAGGGGEQAAAAGGAAAGSTAKRLDLAKVGATISGTVTAESTGGGVGRITVEAYRISATGPVLTSSAATDEEGDFTIAALPPGTYAVRFANPGFVETWYPAAPTREAGETITLDAKEQRAGIDAVITGLPGSLAGIVDTGLDPGTVTATVTIRPLTGGVPGEPVAVTTTDETGAFAAVELETPATYEITATAPGYDPTTTVEQLGGGEHRLTTTLRLSAGDGAISGLVTADGAPVGGVTVVATSGDLEVTSATPTTGAVGRYALAGLPTPGTYLLTFTREGFGGETIAVDLGPGEVRSDLDIALSRGTGSISGTVTDAAGTPLGDVTVTVNGGTTSVDTATLTAGARGSWSVSGLAPGQYTVTFARDGYASVTIAVAVTEGAVRGADATLVPVLASLRGTITGTGGAGVAGATITVRDGRQAHETTSASIPAGAYAVTDLAPGSYAVTVSAPGYRQQTVLVDLTPGAHVTRDIALEALD